MVLDYIEINSPINETLDLKELGMKIIILLTLVTGQRLMTTLIKVDNIVATLEGLQILIPDILKTSKPRKGQPCLMLPFYKNNPALCVASAVLNYVERTSYIRGNLQYLFISSKEPYRQLSK